MELLKYFKDLEKKNLMIPLSEEDKLEMSLFSLNDNDSNLQLELELILIESKILLNEVNKSIGNY